jgi:hypothetical protein
VSEELQRVVESETPEENRDLSISLLSSRGDGKRGNPTVIAVLDMAISIRLERDYRVKPDNDSLRGIFKKIFVVAQT